MAYTVFPRNIEIERKDFIEYGLKFRMTRIKTSSNPNGYTYALLFADTGLMCRHPETDNPLKVIATTWEDAYSYFKPFIEMLIFWPYAAEKA
jgi:hypothetical protein